MSKSALKASLIQKCYIVLVYYYTNTVNNYYDRYQKSKLQLYQEA